MTSTPTARCRKSTSPSAPSSHRDLLNTPPATSGAHFSVPRRDSWRRTAPPRPHGPRRRSHSIEVLAPVVNVLRHWRFITRSAKLDFPSFPPLPHSNPALPSALMPNSPPEVHLHATQTDPEKNRRRPPQVPSSNSLSGTRNEKRRNEPGATTTPTRSRTSAAARCSPRLGNPRSPAFISGHSPSFKKYRNEPDASGS